MDPLYRPSVEQIERAQITHFQRLVEERTGLRFSSYGDFHAWSVKEREDFWSMVWSFCDVIGRGPGDPVLENGEQMPGARWFPKAELNFAENLLRRKDETTAIVFWAEDGRRQHWSYRRLFEEVARLAASLRDLGVVQGDRVAAWLPNLPETVAAALACASLGAIWSSCSPDFGVAAVTDRFQQIRPKVLFAADGVRWGGKVFDHLKRIPEILEGLPTVEHTVVVPYLCENPSLDNLHRALPYSALVRNSADSLSFASLPFDHPLYILYSSGTTGSPKCIVHGAGGTLLQHLKEHRLHTDLRAGERMFYFTTCGWMMWNWLISALATEATVVLYEGSPFYPDERTLWELAATEDVSVFGTSAKYLDALRKRNFDTTGLDLSSLRTVLSTGSPLAPESFDYVYDHIKNDLDNVPVRTRARLALSSISGGTDLISCFVLGNPTLPIWRGEIQCKGLGMDVDVVDDTGRSLTDGPGELVCRTPFPSMPVFFWNDPDGSKFHRAYFDRFANLWCHGDWAEFTEHGGLRIHGRSDATLNPAGVRIGTAEIYRQVEQLDEVLESLAIGQAWEGDVRIVLFVRLRPGQVLDDTLRQRIVDRLRTHASPRHVPAKIVQVPDIPRTKSGKITELAVRAIVHGGEAQNVEALANPEALEHFRNCPELAT